MRRLVLLLVALVLVAGCGSSSDDDTKIVQDYYAAINAGDLDKAMTYVASDAVFANPNGVYRGAAAIRAFLDSSTDIVQELSDFHLEGGKVIYAFKVKQKATGEVLDEGDDGLTIVRNGKIVFDGTEHSLPG